MSYESGIVFSNTAATSTSGTSGVVSLNTRTSCIHFYNTHATTNATVKLNGGPHQVVIPAINSGGGYVEIEGDYTTFQIMTSGVTLAVYAIA
jgi:hypothetical protein